MNQVELIEACKLNNKRAQIALYRKYNQGMYNIAMRLLRNPENAEDVIQDSFISAFKNIRNIRTDITFGAWLKKIVIHKCINYLKKRKLEIINLDETEESHFESEDEDNWEFDESLVLEDVKNCIDKLPDKYKFVVMLYLIEGYDHVEISEILNISEGTSRAQLLRGKIKLRQLLKQSGYGKES